MTDKQIIKEKGNQKCIFYNDDICRKGDKTRDCLNCARVEYHSLYKLNWENQERLESQLKRKKQECKRLKEGYSELTDIVSPYMDDFTGYNEGLGGFDIVLCIKELMEQLDQLKAENDELKKIIERLDVPKHEVIDMDIALENERLKDRIDNIRDFAKQGRDMFVEQGSFADWYKVAECMKNDFNFILYEIDDEE